MPMAHDGELLEIGTKANFNVADAAARPELENSHSRGAPLHPFAISLVLAIVFVCAFAALEILFMCSAQLAASFCR